MVRPYIKSTVRVSSLMRTSLTRSSVTRSKMVMPCLQHRVAVFGHNAEYGTDLLRAKAAARGKTGGIEPKLGGRIVAIDVDVRRLVALVAEEVEAVRADPQDGGHGVVLAI